MEILSHSLAALWQVLVVGLVLGAGLPALFALGMLSLSRGRVAGPDGRVATNAPVSSLGKVGAFVCFGLVIITALFGIVVIVHADWAFSLLGAIAGR